MKWTKESLIAQVRHSPRVENDEERWAQIWTRNVQEFDLSFRLAEPEIPYEEWDKPLWDTMIARFIRTDNIRYTTQTSVRLDVLFWYMQDPLAQHANFDTEGWMNNDYPVVIELPDGSYIIRDGHHRIISKILNRRRFVEAYVMKGK